MVPGYYIHERSGELEAVERWENEGGRLLQNHDFILDAIGEDYRRRKDQVMKVGRLGKRDEISRVKLFLTSDKAKSITGQTVVVDGERTLPQPAFAV